MTSSKLVNIKDIIEAKNTLKNYVIKTPLIYDFNLSQKYKAKIFYKAEGTQRTGSFKIRGAYNKINKLIDNDNNGVLAWSSGNHAQGVAEAAKIFKIKATIIMPKDAPKIKIEGTKSRGANIILYNRKKENREEIGKNIAEQKNLSIIPPYDDKFVIAGQGSIGLEIIDQIKEYDLRPDKILVPTGGGGLIAGISIALKKKYKNINIYSVEPKSFSDYSKSLKNKKIIHNDMNSYSICDSLLANMPGKITFDINRGLIKRGLTVTDNQVFKAIKYAYQNLGLILEPGGAVALAAILNKKTEIKNKTIVAVLSGSNIDPKILAKAVK